MGARNGRSQVVAEALQDLQRFKESEEMRLFKTFHSWKKKNLMNEPYLLEIALSLLQQRWREALGCEAWKAILKASPYHNTS